MASRFESMSLLAALALLPLAPLEAQVAVKDPPNASIQFVGPDPYCDVTSQGADTTGTTDSLAAFNSCKNQFGSTSNGGLILVPPGIYRFTGPFHVDKSMRLYGTGQGYGSPSPILKFDPGQGGLIIDSVGTSPSGTEGARSIIEGLAICGSLATGTITSGSNSMTSVNTNPSNVCSVQTDFSSGNYIPAVGDLIQALAPSSNGGFPAGTIVTAVSGTSPNMTVTASNNALATGSTRLLKLGAPLGTGTTSNGSTTVTSVSSCSSWFPGDGIQGPGIPLNDTVFNTTCGSSTITLGVAAGSGAGTGTLYKVADGINMKRLATVRDVLLDGFGGTGVSIYGNASNTPSTNANLFRLDNVWPQYMGGFCIRVQGNDASAGNTVSSSAINCSSGGMYDQSLLGNQWFGPHASGNGGAPYNCGNGVWFGTYTEGGQGALTNCANGGGNLAIGAPQVQRLRFGTGNATATASTLTSANFSNPQSSGWGTTSTLSVNPSSGSTDAGFGYSIAATGTGQTANPTITLTFADGAWPGLNGVNAGCWRVDTNAPTGNIVQVTGVSQTAITMTWVFTPVAGKTYTANCVVFGRP